MITIKKIKKYHLNNLLLLWNKSKAIDLNRYDDSFKRLKYFLKRNGKYCFCAFNKNELIGGALAGEDGKRGTIYHLIVLDSYQHQGIATEIVKKICQEMKKNGILKINATSFKKSKISCSFWKSIGFEEREELSMFSLKLL